jgi:hypothetical protein
MKEGPRQVLRVPSAFLSLEVEAHCSFLSSPVLLTLEFPELVSLPPVSHLFGSTAVKKIVDSVGVTMTDQDWVGGVVFLKRWWKLGIDIGHR